MKNGILEEGRTYHGLMFVFADGYFFRWTPGGLPVMVESDPIRFEKGPVDEFGVPPHEHPDVQFSSGADLSTLDGALSSVLQASKKHGPPQSVSVLFFKKVGRYVVTLGTIPPSPWGGGPTGYVVSALAASEGVTGPSVEELVALGEAGAKTSVQEHDHWFASEKPLPFTAALWIFRSVTEDNISATNCNCDPEERPGRPSRLGMTAADLGLSEDEVDEVFVGDSSVGSGG